MHKYANELYLSKINSMENFKIGDKVFYIFGEGKFEIIASKESAYLHFGVTPLYPNEGYDFILKSIELKDGEFKPFQHVPKEHLNLID